MKVNLKKIEAVSGQDRELILVDLIMTSKYSVKPPKPRDPLKAQLLRKYENKRGGFKIGQI